MSTVIRGRIHASNSTHFNLTVFPTLKEMRSYCKRVCGKKGTAYMGRNALAACHSWKRIDFSKGKKGRNNPEMGEVHLAQTRSDSEIVSHECAHAAFQYIRRKYRVNGLLTLKQKRGCFVNGMEEDYCLALGRLFRSANLELHRLGVWK